MIVNLSKTFVKIAQNIDATNVAVPKPKQQIIPKNEFDLNFLKLLNKPEHILSYAKEYLNLVSGGKFSEVTGGGLGSSRQVFDLGDKVLKVAYNSAGLAQNNMEARIQNASPIFAKVFDMHPKALWIISEKIKPFTSDQFSIVTGIPKDIMNSKEFKQIIGRLTPENLDYLRARYDLEEDSLNLLKEISKSRGKFDIIMGDLLDPEHWGQNEQGDLKVYDYGLDRTLFDTHYQDGIVRTEPASLRNPEPSISEEEALKELEEDKTFQII